MHNWSKSNLIFQVLSLLHHHLVNHLLSAKSQSIGTLYQSSINWVWNLLKLNLFFYISKKRLLLSTNLSEYSWRQPAHVFVLATAFQPEVLYPPIGEVVRKSYDAPERFGSACLLFIFNSGNQISHFIRCMQTTRSVVVEDCFEGTRMSVKEELVIWPIKIGIKDI